MTLSPPGTLPLFPFFALIVLLSLILIIWLNGRNEREHPFPEVFLFVWMSVTLISALTPEIRELVVR